jgi:hypothetical protein
MKFPVLVLLLFVAAAASAADDPFDHVQPNAYHEMQKQASEAYDREDFSKAFELNRKIACAGDKTSQAILGRMYVLGQGTEKDPITGYAWIRVAADFPFADFTSLARKLEAAMTPDQLAAGTAKADTLRKNYGFGATNMSCHGTSRRGVYLIDSVVCTPENDGSGELMLRRCLDAQ